MSNPNKLTFKATGIGPNTLLAQASEGPLEAKPISDFVLALLESGDQAAFRAAINAAANGSVGSAGAGSIMIQAGELAASNDVPVGYTVQGLATADYILTGWDLWVYPVGSLKLDVRSCALSSLPMVPEYSMTPSDAAKPQLVAAETASGDMSLWGNDVVEMSDALSVVVVENTGVKWFTLLLKGTKP